MTTITVSSGVTSSGLTVSYGEQVGVGFSGTVIDTRIEGGGNVYVVGGGATGTVISSGGSLTVEQLGQDFQPHYFGYANGTVVLSGGIEVLSEGGVETSGTVSAGGTLVLFDEVVSKGATISTGVQSVYQFFNGTNVGDTSLERGSILLLTSPLVSGAVFVGEGDTISAATVLSGGVVRLSAWGRTSGTDVDRGGVETILSRGLAFDTTVAGYEFDYGLASGSVVQGGNEIILARGFASATEVIGGQQTVASGGSAGGTVVLGGADQSIFVGGQASGTVISIGGSQLDAGFALATMVSSGGTQVVISSGVAMGAEVFGLGRQVVSADGTAVGTTVFAGAQTILSQGQASGTVLSGTLFSGAFQFDYGDASGTYIEAQGLQVVEAGGIASSEVISSAGREIVVSGGLTFAPTILSGGWLAVSSGGAVSSGLTLAGGTAYLAGAMSAGQTVSFGVGDAGVLALELLTSFRADIWGLSSTDQKIDLTGFDFSAGETSAWAQSGTSGTLTIVDGAHTARLTLDGTYTTEDFQLSEDARGGTFITDPRAAPAAAQEPTRFAEAMAGFSDRSEGVATIHAGGTALAIAAPLAATASSGR
jgi:autotransporter passenger strand-loop-strand repeat protein